MIKDSHRVPFLSDLTDFSYLNGKVNLQWQDLKRLKNIEGDLNFILKDLTLDTRATSSVALNLLGIFNLKNILGKVANLDLSIDEYTSTKLNRAEDDLVFNERKARLLSPLFIETNAAKMKWVGQIRKNSFGELNYLDLNLDLKVMDSARYNPNYPNKSVIEQNPLAGDFVKEKRKIYLVLNPSKYRDIEIPDVNGQTNRQASTELKSIGFKIGSDFTYVPDIGKNVVRGLKFDNKIIKAGDKLPENSTIELILGDGSRN